MALPDIAAEAFAMARRSMVDGQIRKRGIVSSRVLEAMLSVPRHEFVPAEFRSDAYADKPLPLGEGRPSRNPSWSEP